MGARPLIIDCDPGQDDAIALLMAIASPEEFALLGVTTVAGNVPSGEDGGKRASDKGPWPGSPNFRCMLAARGPWCALP